MLATAILAAVVGLTYLLIALPLRELYLEREAVRANRAMLATRLLTAPQELPLLRARLAELRASAATSNLTLEGASDAIAAANLQSRIEALAASFGITLGSTEALPAEERNGFRRIGLRIGLHGDYDNLVRLVAAIETSAPPLILDNLRIRSAPRPAGAPGGARLDAGFEVYGVRGNPSVSAQR